MKKKVIVGSLLKNVEDFPNKKVDYRNVSNCSFQIIAGEFLPSTPHLSPRWFCRTQGAELARTFKEDAFPHPSSHL